MTHHDSWSTVIENYRSNGSDDVTLNTSVVNTINNLMFSHDIVNAGFRAIPIFQ